MSYEQSSHDTQNDVTPTTNVTLSDGNGRTFDVPAQSVDDLLMLAALTRQPAATVFATAVETTRSAALAKPRGAAGDPSVPKAPKASKAKG